MTANNEHFYLSYLKKVVDEYNHNYQDSIGKKPVDADYSALSEKIETNLKSPRFKFGVRVKIACIKKFLA